MNSIIKLIIAALFLTLSSLALAEEYSIRITFHVDSKVPFNSLKYAISPMHPNPRASEFLSIYPNPLTKDVSKGQSSDASMNLVVANPKTSNYTGWMAIKLSTDKISDFARIEIGCGMKTVKGPGDFNPQTIANCSEYIKSNNSSYKLKTECSQRNICNITVENK